MHSNTSSKTELQPKLPILMKVLTKLAKQTLEHTNSLHLLTFKQIAHLNCKRQLPSNPYQSLLMQPTGNSTVEVLSAIAVKLWTTVSWVLVTILTAAGLLRTLGELAGEYKDISLLRKETLAVLQKLPLTLLFERIGELIKPKN